MSRLSKLPARAASLGPRGLDWALAGVLLAWALAESLTRDHATSGQRAVLLVLSVAIAVLAIWRRRIPAAGLLVFSATLIASGEMGDDVANTVTMPFVGLFVFSYALGAYSGRRQVALGALPAAAGVLYTILVEAPDAGEMVANAVFASMFVGAPFLVGRAMRNRRVLAAALAEKNEQLAREREARARRAVEQERARIARELHDVVAHSISVMTVQAEAVSRVATKMPEQARTSLATIETTGREALTEMRRLLGVLRRDDEAAELSPQPSLAQVRLLVNRARAAGLAADLRVEGQQRPLPAGVDLAAYRVVQEALADTLARAGARNATVTIRYGDRNVRLEVTDDGSPSREAGELHGMRERVALYGGDLRTGPGDAGGHAVRARLPLDLVHA